MTEIDPRWRSTSSDVPASPGSAHVTIRGAGPSFAGVSRTPAAVVGIVLVVAVGFLAMSGWTSLLGQAVTGANEVIIRLTSQGPDPKDVEVPGGSVIAFINETETAQILQSETLRDKDNKLLYTAAIFPGSRVTFDVAAGPVPGDPPKHNYASITDPIIAGTVAVVPRARSSAKAIFGGTDGIDLPGLGNGRSGSNTTRSRSSATASIAQTPPVQVSVSGEEVSGTSASVATKADVPASSAAPLAARSSAAAVVVTTVTPTQTEQPADTTTTTATTTTTTQASASDLIPFNPYTVDSRGSSVIPTATTSGNKASSKSGTMSTTASVHTGPRAPSQPSSGPEVWIALALSASAVPLLHRRTLKAYR